MGAGCELVHSHELRRRRSRSRKSRRSGGDEKKLDFFFLWQVTASHSRTRKHEGSAGGDVSSGHGGICGTRQREHCQKKRDEEEDDDDDDDDDDDEEE